MLYPTKSAQQFSAHIPHGPQLYVLRCSVNSANWPTIGPKPTVFRQLAYSVIG